MTFWIGENPNLSEGNNANGNHIVNFGIEFEQASVRSNLKIGNKHHAGILEELPM